MSLYSLSYLSNAVFFFSLYRVPIFLKQLFCLYALLWVTGSLRLAPLPLLKSTQSVSVSLCILYAAGFQNETNIIQAWNIVPIALYPTMCVSLVMILFSLAFLLTLFPSAYLSLSFVSTCSLLPPPFSTFVYLEGIQRSQQEERGLEVRLWWVDLSHWCWL